METVQRAGSRDVDSPGRQKAKLGADLKPQAPRVGVGSQCIPTSQVRADQASVGTPPSGRGPKKDANLPMWKEVLHCFRAWHTGLLCV